MQSDHVVIEAPMSFTGSAKRIMKLSDNGLVKLCLLLPLVLVAWFVIFWWYVIFGLLLVPYRLIRRSSRKQKRDALRHKELVEAAKKG